MGVEFPVLRAVFKMLKFEVCAYLFKVKSKIPDFGAGEGEKLTA